MARETETQRMERRLRDVISAMEALLAPSAAKGRGTVIADLIARGEESSVIDGYPRGTSGEKTSGGDGGDPTLSTYLAREADVCPRCVQGQLIRRDGSKVTCPQCGGSGRRWADPVGDAVLALRGLILSVSHQARTMDKHRLMVLRTVPAPGRQSALQGNCIVCGKWVPGTATDRLKRGMDNACYLSWSAWKMKHGETADPGEDFHRFTLERQHALAEKERREAEAEDHERKAKRR